MQSYIDWIADENFEIRGHYNPVTDVESASGPLMLLPHQVDILGHTLTPYLEDGKWKLPYTTVIYSCVKKSGKTTIGASVGSWAMDTFVPNTEGFCLAGDFEHAMGRMFDDMLYDAKDASKLSATPRKDLLKYEDGRYMQALAQEYKSASGSRHALTLWDELWTYTSDGSRRLWVEMTPIKIPGVPLSLRFVSTYAGFEGESDLLWGLYKMIVLEGEPVPELAHIVHDSGEPTCYRNGRMFAYWDSAHRMPWQTEDYYLEQLASGMSQNEYARLHENAWSTGSESFMPVKWWDAAEKLEGSLEYDVKNPRRKLPVVVACDASTKHDSTALVGLQYDYDSDLVTLAFHRIWTPTPDEPMDFEHTLERYLLERHNEGFNITSIVYDPTQLHRSMTRLGTVFDNVEEFPQTLNNMISASETLYGLFKNQKIAVYPDEDLRAHLQYAMAEDKGRGFRIVKAKKAAHHHTDAAVAMAMAAHQVMKTGGFDVSKEIRVEVPFSEDSEWGPVENEEAMAEQLGLPYQLRDAGMNQSEYDAEWERRVDPSKH